MSWLQRYVTGHVPVKVYRLTTAVSHGTGLLQYLLLLFKVRFRGCLLGRTFRSYEMLKV